MTNSKIAKWALFRSIVSLILFFSMLLGTTFAWFTDSVSSGVNRIVAGNLDIELYHSATGTPSQTGGDKVTENTQLFQMTLWEPGAVVYENFLIANEGTLALKYALDFNAANVTQNYVVEKDGDTLTGTSRSLVDVLYVKISDDTVSGARPSYTAADGMKLKDFLADTNISIATAALEAGGTRNLSVAVYWPQSENDNQYNLKDGWYSAENAGDTTSDGKNSLYVELPIVLNACQHTSESDSFNNQYDAGASGSYTYVGYDGYIWNGSERTDQPAEDFSRDNHVIESTMGIQDAMSRYFAGEYVDLTSNQIALLNNYQPYAQLTAYSETKITEIQVVSETTGTLYIGTMKVADVVNTRTRAAANGAMYNVTVGVNAIALDLNVAEDETIVLGGNGSTAKLYVAKGIPTDDQDGNFTLLDGQPHAEVIAQTNGYADTLAVQVRTGSASQIPVFDNVKQWLPESSLSGANAVKHNFAPFVYSNLQYFAGKHITRIDIPVKTVQAGQTPTFTVRVVKQADVQNKNVNMVFGEPQALTFTQTIDSSTTNSWFTALCDIHVGEDETLVFGAPTDTINWGYREYSSTQPTYGFYYKVGQSASSVASTASIYFDVYEEKYFDFARHLEVLMQKEEQARQQAIKDQQLAQFADILNGKQLSILGDSISTFIGVSNDAAEGLDNNAVYYNPRGLTQADTYWQQILTQFNMNLCINNSWSGSYATQHQPNANGHLDQTGAISSGMARADKLAKKDGTTPDYIVVFIGINDLNAGVSSAVFSEAYNQILDTITAT